MNATPHHSGLLRLLIASLLVLSSACGADSSADYGGPNPTTNPPSNVGQSGAQDFGRFRSIIEAGEIPAPNTLDMVGFFNEHYFELPGADCGENVCLHGMFGVWGNMLNGANCTLTMLGFNTPLDPKVFERPPLNMAIAVDVSGSMAGQPIDSVKIGLRKMASQLKAKDTVTLIAYSNEARELIVSDPQTDPDRSALIAIIDGLRTGGGTNIYDGLRTALETVDATRDAQRQNRVILLSDGVATSGLQDTDRIVNLGDTYAQREIGITTIGVGEDFDMELMRRLSESGSGNFYFIENLATVEEVFGEEVNTFLIPVANDVHVELDVSPGYRFRATYGTRLWEGEADRASIYIPSLFIASREGADDIGPGGGRRGGGGAILFELVPSADNLELAKVGENAPVGQLSMTYTLPGSDQSVTTSTTVINTLPPGVTPEEGRFDNSTVEKAFVALNLYMGFKLATEAYANGSTNKALNILQPLEKSATSWVAEHPDADIESDLKTMRQLISVLRLEPRDQSPPQPAPNPWPHD